MGNASDTRNGVSKSMKRNIEMIDLTLAGGAWALPLDATHFSGFWNEVSHRDFPSYGPA